MVKKRVRRREELIIKQLNERPELKSIPLVWRRRKQKKVSCVPPQHFGKLIVLRSTGLVARTCPGEVMGLIENDRVPPWRTYQPLDPFVSRTQRLPFGISSRFMIPTRPPRGPV